MVYVRYRRAHIIAIIMIIIIIIYRWYDQYSVRGALAYTHCLSNRETSFHLTSKRTHRYVNEFRNTIRVS